MLYPLLPLGPSLLPSPTQSRQRSPCRRPCRDLQMDPDPLRLLETAHPLRSPTLRPSPPNSRFRLRPSYRLTRPKTVNKRVNKIEKFVDGPTQMSRRRRYRPFFRPLPSWQAASGSTEDEERRRRGRLVRDGKPFHPASSSVVN